MSSTVHQVIGRRTSTCTWYKYYTIIELRSTPVQVLGVPVPELSTIVLESLVAGSYWRRLQ